MTQQITLSRGRGVALVDDDVYAWASQRKWFFKTGRYAACYVRNAQGVWKQQYLHRLIANPPVGFEVDHINGNGMDNRRENLRNVTHAENILAQRNAHASSYTGLRGVSQTSPGRYSARLQLGRKWVLLGNFNTPEEASVVVEAEITRRLAHRRPLSELLAAAS